jgi:hypothetical protein
MQRKRFLNISLYLAVNILLSWILLPFVIPTFGGYSLSKLLEVLLWQGIGMVGWPFALLGVVLSISFGTKLTSAYSILFILMYPAIQFLLIRSTLSRTPRRVELILMHLFVTFSFAVVWYYVLHGYDFMSG